MSRAITGSALSGPALTRAFLTLLACEGLPDPVTEHRFAAPDRQWRFDFAWPEQRVALEVEGGVWIRGRHTRGQGFIDDLEKYNDATVRGWRVLRVTPQQLCTEETAEMLARLLPRSVPRGGAARRTPHSLPRDPSHA